MTSRTQHSSPSSPTQTDLDRRLGVGLLTFYGVGTIVGGGVYALLGKVAEHAGTRAPWSFLLATVIAMFSAYSFSELSRRFPVSSGVAHYVQTAFGRSWLSASIGWMVIATGVVSAATLVRAFAGFSATLVALPEWLLMALVVAILSAIACYGIVQSAWFATVITFIEVGGLLIVILTGSRNLLDIGDRWTEVCLPVDMAGWWGIAVGGYLAFYAFIGFEDLVTVAEETKNPNRTLPLAIWLSLLLSAALYCMVTLVIVLSVPIDELAKSPTPLALIFEGSPWLTVMMTLIGMLAGVNGALIQIVMASRMAFGMAGQGQAPRIMRRLHPGWKTPVPGTLLLAAVILLSAWWIPLAKLAQITTTILMAVFALTNGSLIVVRLREHRRGERQLDWRILVPILGMLLCVGFIIIRLLALFSLEK